MGNWLAFWTTLYIWLTPLQSIIKTFWRYVQPKVCIDMSSGKQISTKFGVSEWKNNELSVEIWTQLWLLDRKCEWSSTRYALLSRSCRFL